MVADKPAFDTLVGIAPDAKFLVYTAAPEIPPESVKPEGLLMVRRLDRDESAVIDGTEGALGSALSPDGRWIAYCCAKDRARSKLSIKRVALEDGRPAGKPETVCEVQQGAFPAVCWASDREIVFAPAWEPTIFIVSASGGEPRVVLREDLPKGIESWADFQPFIAGKSILATRWSLVGQKIKVNTEVIDLISGKRTVVLPDAGAAHLVSDGSRGFLLAMRNTQNTLIAVRFDRDSLHTVGEPVTVWSGNPINGFQLSASGTLALATRPTDLSDRRLAWIDDKGQPQPIPGMTRAFLQVVVSPDGGRVLVRLDNAGSPDLASDLWVHDLARRSSVRIPVQGALLGMVWNSDGQRVTYALAANDEFSIWERRSDGSGEPVKLFTGPDSRTLLWPSIWSPDGKMLAFTQLDMSADNPDAYVLESQAGSKPWAAKPYLKTPAADELLRFSPDGKWALLQSSLSGRAELYVQPFTGDGEADARAGRVQVSTGGGGLAWWSPDGKEIRYIDADNQVMSVQATTGPTFSATEPKALYSIKDLKTKSVTFGPDGRLMVVLQGESERVTTTVGLVVNFREEFAARMTAAK